MAPSVGVAVAAAVALLPAADASEPCDVVIEAVEVAGVDAVVDAAASPLAPPVAPDCLPSVALSAVSVLPLVLLVLPPVLLVVLVLLLLPVLPACCCTCASEPLPVPSLEEPPALLSLSVLPPAADLPEPSA
jgi:hypothetical protein